MIRRIAVRAVVVKDRKLLAMKAKPYHDSIRQDIWFTIGGGLDDGEALLDGLRREVLEETGVEPVIGALLYVQQYRDEVKENMEFFFHVTNTDDFLEVDLSKSSHGDTEIAALEFINAANEPLFPEFLRTESFDDLENQPTKFFTYL